MNNRIDRSAKSEGGGDNFVAWLYPGRENTQVKCGGTRIQGDSMWRSLVGGKITLKLGHFGAGTQPAAAHDPLDLTYLIFFDERRAEYQESVLRTDGCGLLRWV